MVLDMHRGKNTPQENDLMRLAGELCKAVKWTHRHDGSFRGESKYYFYFLRVSANLDITRSGRIRRGHEVHIVYHKQGF